MTVMIPEPLPDDPNYFQILLDSKIDSKRVHLTFTANKMSRMDTRIENITWLTGGGTTLKDYSKPVMQIVNSPTGVSDGANFADTYDILLSDLPMDPSQKYHVLKIPFLDSADSTKSLAGSGHLTITLDAPAVMQINMPNQGGSYAFALPSPDQNGAGSNNRWDFVELNCATSASNNKPVCFCNTTNVDFFSLGIAIMGRQSDSKYVTFGLDLSGATPVRDLINALKNLPLEYAAGLIMSGSNFLRFQAPGLSFSSSATALDTAISDGFNYYKTKLLEFKVQDTEYKASTSSDGETLNFTAPTQFTVAKPTTLNVIASTGSLKTDKTDEINNALKFIGAALNRGVFTNTAAWSVVSNWYPAGVESNAYSKLLHSKFLGGACYAFSFDDVPGSPVTSAPAIGTCTSMTLVITDM